MEKKEFASVAEIDAALEKEFATPDVADEEEEFDEPLEDDEEIVEDDDEVIEDEEAEALEDEDEKPEQTKPSKEDKKEYAFKKLREEKANAERLAQMERAAKLEATRAAEAEKEFMKKLARTSGYGDDVEAYRKDLEKRLIEEEAKQHGVSPEVYRQLADAKSKVEKLEKEKVESERTARSQRFLSTIDKVLAEYDVDREKMSKQLFATLEKSGYNIDALLAVPQPEILIRGALYDQLSKAKVRDSKISEGLETKRLKNSAQGVKTMDELIEEEMVAYAKERNLKYVK